MYAPLLFLPPIPQPGWLCTVKKCANRGACLSLGLLLGLLAGVGPNPPQAFAQQPAYRPIGRAGTQVTRSPGGREGWGWHVLRSKTDYTVTFTKNTPALNAMRVAGEKLRFTGTGWLLGLSNQGRFGQDNSWVLNVDALSEDIPVSGGQGLELGGLSSSIRFGLVGELRFRSAAFFWGPRLGAYRQSWRFRPRITGSHFAASTGVGYGVSAGFESVGGWLFIFGLERHRSSTKTFDLSGVQQRYGLGGRF